MSESNTDRYLAARERHTAAQAQKRALAQQLRQLAQKLEDPGGISDQRTQRREDQPRLRAHA